MFSLANVACQPYRPLDSNMDASVSVREGFKSHYRVLDSIIGLALIIIGSIAVANLVVGHQPMSRLVWVDYVWSRELFK